MLCVSNLTDEGDFEKMRNVPLLHPDVRVKLIVVGTRSTRLLELERR